MSLSERIEQLIAEVENLPLLNCNNSIPKSFIVPCKQQYQEYFHLQNPKNNYFNEYFKEYYDGKNGGEKSQKKQQKHEKRLNKKTRTEEVKQMKDEIKHESATDDDELLIAFAKCNFVVGRVLSVRVHSGADNMYIEEIEIGESEPRTIVSGIRNHITEESLVGSLIIVFANLKAAKLRGVASHGMILAASNADHSIIQIIRPPKGCKIGERIVLENNDLSAFEIAERIKARKKNSPWMKIKDLLTTDDECCACFRKCKFMTSAGPLKCDSLSNATIS